MTTDKESIEILRQKKIDLLDRYERGVVSDLDAAWEASEISALGMSVRFIVAHLMKKERGAI